METQEQKESIKLMKMSKGYQWEIKLLCQDETGIIGKPEIDRLRILNEQLKKDYGETQ